MISTNQDSHLVIHGIFLMEQREPGGSTKKEVEGAGDDIQQVHRKTARANKNRATLRKQLMVSSIFQVHRII